MNEQNVVMVPLDPEWADALVAHVLRDIAETNAKHVMEPLTHKEDVDHALSVIDAINVLMEYFGQEQVAKPQIGVA